MNKLYLIGGLSLAMLSTGCASIVSGSNQSVSVETKQKGTQISNANCKLSNDKGTWFVTTPGSVTVNRSFGDMAVRCEKPGMEPGLLTAKSSTKAMAFGNILFGGAIGAGVDMATGAAYDYPSLFTVEMPETAAFAPAEPPAAPEPRAEAANAGVDKLN